MKFKILTLILLFLTVEPLKILACTIFLVNDGKHVWVGNNEDEEATMNYRFYFIPAAAKSYRYIVWSELHNVPAYDPVMDQYPQGGLNEHGLFMDYTAIDEFPVRIDPSKVTRSKEVVNDLLQSCKTVDEALSFIRQYNLVKLAAAQLFIADATGDYATVHGNYIVRKTTTNFALTNYCIGMDCLPQPCWRRDVANKYIATNNIFELTDVVEVLKNTAQTEPSDVVTNYSMAVDLHSKTIHLYKSRDYENAAIISLSDQKTSDKYHKNIADFFVAN